jgi:CRISPR-associated protein Csb3
MAQASIPVDLFNPGQVFACMGFLEATEVLLGNARGGFAWSHSGDFFNIDTGGHASTIEVVLDFVKEAEVKWLSPRCDLKERDGGDTEVLDGIAASGDPKNADLPGVLRSRHNGTEHEMTVGFWADGSSRFATTFKKSTNGASAHIRLNNALRALKQWETKHVAVDPFNQEARTESLFRLDPRGSVDPIHGGFSPDSLRKGAKGGLDVRVATYPICELLAILGLEHARPERLDSNRFAYCVWDRPLPPVLARAAIGGQRGFGRMRRFLVEHEEVKKGGDRKMSDVTEELMT